MAIDYKKEWEKLLSEYGDCYLCKEERKSATRDNTLEQIMCWQKDDSIHKREKLMEGFVRSRISTDIVGGAQGYHKVRITNISKGHVDTIYVSKKDFAKWCEKKGDK